MSRFVNLSLILIINQRKMNTYWGRILRSNKNKATTEQIQETFDLVKNFIEKTKSDEKKIDVTEQTVEAEVA